MISRMQWRIEPAVGFGPIELGASRLHVRTVLSDYEVTEYERWGEERPVDHFRQLGVQVGYSGEDRVKSIEVDPKVIGVEWLGWNLFDVDVRNFISELASSNIAVSVFDEGYDLPEHNISLYVPDGVIEAVGLNALD